MNILVFNIGSSTIKYSVYSKGRLVLDGLVDDVKSYSAGLKKVEAAVKGKNIRIDAVGHRVVHGGNTKAPQRITEDIISIIRKNERLAPLHNPPNLKGILAALKLFDVPQVAVFDTAFHSSMPAVAYTYAIPKAIREKHSIRRYGFHGISHEYVYLEACRLLRRNPKSIKAITCHLGNGCSVTAIDKGKSVDTSMGFTPLEGVVMGTRSGSIDPAIIDFIVRNEKIPSSKVNAMLNKRSGLLGLSGRTHDMRKLLHSKDRNSRLAIDVFCYSVMKCIGAYASVLNGVDAIVFTAGIGENSWLVRKKIAGSLKHLGVKLDENKNRLNSQIISAGRSKVKLLVIPTREDKMIALQTERLIKNK